MIVKSIIITFIDGTFHWKWKIIGCNVTNLLTVAAKVINSTFINFIKKNN